MGGSRAVVRVRPGRRAAPPYDRVDKHATEKGGATMSAPDSTAAIDSAALSGDYTFDVAHSTFGFVARHVMVTKVRGTFREFEGSAHLDFVDLSKSSVLVTIKVASIDTRNADRDAHLRSNDFFAMEDYPEITFTSTQLEVAGEDIYRVVGDLTIRGITKSVQFDAERSGPVIDPWGNTRIGFSGTLKVNRKDWGVNWNMALEAGGIAVSEDVTLEFDISATKNT
ncbi:MAG TPA: YceI family protein [Gaiellaceae bacterium]|nr:YceI family protein [Gaiellaceae bacterium]